MQRPTRETLMPKWIVALCICLALGNPVAALELVILGSSTVSKDLTPQMFGPVSIAVEDHATGRCWTNIKQVRRYAETELRKLGFEVAEEAAGQLQISVSAQRETGSGCFGFVNLRLRNTSFGPKMDFAERSYAIVEKPLPANVNEYVFAVIEALVDDIRAAQKER